RLHLADDVVELLLAGRLEDGLVEVEVRIRLEGDLLVHRRWRGRRRGGGRLAPLPAGGGTGEPAGGGAAPPATDCGARDLAVTRPVRPEPDAEPGAGAAHHGPPGREGILAVRVPPHRSAASKRHGEQDGDQGAGRAHASTPSGRLT